jgi:hypothetical protein
MMGSTTSPPREESRMTVQREQGGRMTEYNWLPRSRDYCEAWKLDVEMIEAVVEHGQPNGLHPASSQHGYPIESYRRGDLEVCVSRKPGEQPAIAYVHLHLPTDFSKGSHSGGGGGPIKKAAAKAPNGLKEFKNWVFAAGYKPSLQNGHIHVRRPDGSLLMTTGSTPGDKMAVTVAWQKFLRESAKDSVIKSLNEDGVSLGSNG